MCPCTVIQETLFASDSQQEFLSEKTNNEVSHALPIQAPSRFCIDEFQACIIAQAQFFLPCKNLQNALKKKYIEQNLFFP